VQNIIKDCTHLANSGKTIVVLLHSKSWWCSRQWGGDTASKSPLSDLDGQSLVDDLTIWQQDLICQNDTGKKYFFFRLTKVTVHPATKSGASQQVTRVSVANVKQCLTKLEGGLPQLHMAEDAAVQWLMSRGS